MHCQACGAQLPSGAKACPNCGTRTPAYYANSGASPNDPTIPAASESSPSAVSAPLPSTQYGSNPYPNMSLQSPYDVNPYNAVPPPPPPRKVSPVMLGILTAVVLLVVGASVGFVFLRNHPTKTNIPPTATTSVVSNTRNADTNATATAQSIAVATAPAAKDPYPPTNGKLTLDDPLSRPFQWEANPTNSVGLTCGPFSNGAYHVSESKIGFAYSCPDQAQFSNFAFEVQMTILHGDCGGIIFRNNGTKFYLFEFCANGYYVLYAGLDNTLKTLVNKSSSAITTGYNQLNTIAVVANGSKLDLYANHQKIDSVSDSTYTGAGFIGLAAEADVDPTELAFSNAKVWTF